MRSFNFSIIAGLTLMLMLAGSAAQAQYQFLNEPFTGTSAPDWTFVNAAGDGPILTAPSIDTAGNGWLRLTANKRNQNSFVYYNNPIPTLYGLDITFRFVIWTNASQNADGFALVLWDSNAVASSGGWGGSLGYAQHTAFGSVGLNGGFVAFGFDTFGNFSNPTEGRTGGPGSRPHAVALRGPMGDDRSQGYAYITGANSSTAFSNTGQTRRPTSSYRQFIVNLVMTPDNRVTIRMRRSSTSTWTTLVHNYQTSLTFPERVNIGYTASTGDVYSYHEIRNLVVTTVDDPECIDDGDCAGEYCVAYICDECRTDTDCDAGYVCNNDYACEEDTLIELSNFDAVWQPEGVAVSWVTDTEIDNAYFDIYRAESIKAFPRRFKGFGKNSKKYFSKKWMRKGSFVKINAVPIPAEGLAPFGASYEFLDTDVEHGKRYWYMLQDVDLYGTATQHGPCGPVSAWEDCSYQP